jgi:hypothetical protein
MQYFKIQETTVATSPFETARVNAIRWVVGNIPRNASVADLNCTLIYVHPDDTIDDMLYSYVLYLPKSVLDIWLDDGVIDDYIITESNGSFIKE